MRAVMVEEVGLSPAMLQDPSTAGCADVPTPERIQAHSSWQSVEQHVLSIPGLAAQPPCSILKEPQ